MSNTSASHTAIVFNILGIGCLGFVFGALVGAIGLLIWSVFSGSVGIVMAGSGLFALPILALTGSIIGGIIGGIVCMIITAIFTIKPKRIDKG